MDYADSSSGDEQDKFFSGQESLNDKVNAILNKKKDGRCNKLKENGDEDNLRISSDKSPEDGSDTVDLEIVSTEDLKKSCNKDNPETVAENDEEKFLDDKLLKIDDTEGSFSDSDDEDVTTVQEMLDSRDRMIERQRLEIDQKKEEIKIAEKNLELEKQKVANLTTEKINLKNEVQELQNQLHLKSANDYSNAIDLAMSGM